MWLRSFIVWSRTKIFLSVMLVSWVFYFYEGLLTLSEVEKGGYLLEWKYENNLPHTPIGLESWKPNLPFLIPIAGSSSLLFLLNWLGDTASRCTETKSLSGEFRQKRVLEDFAKDEEDEISEICVESQSKWYADDYERDRIFAVLAKYLLKREIKLYLHIISE